MTKLSLDALKMRAEAVASEELMATISGGTENACHDGSNPLKDYADGEAAAKKSMHDQAVKFLKWLFD